MFPRESGLMRPLHEFGLKRGWFLSLERGSIPTMIDDPTQPCTTNRATQVWDGNSRHSTPQLSNLTRFKEVEATLFSVRTHEEDARVLTIGETSVPVRDSLQSLLQIDFMFSIAFILSYLVTNSKKI